MSDTIDIKNKKEIKKILQDDFNEWKTKMTTGETKETKEDSDFKVTKTEFKLQVDPNHVLGSSIKKIDKELFRTEYNLCSTLVIHVENKWVNKSSLQEKRKVNIDKTKSKKYQGNHLESLDRKYKYNEEKKDEWKKYVNGSLINGKYPELAWNSPMWIGEDKYKDIKYTSSFTAGLINLDTATAQRGGKEWGYKRNLKKAQKLTEPLNGLFPVIETCGVIIIHDSTGEILTFPNIKFATLYSTPGGSIDYDSYPPKNMTNQILMAIENCFRELEEEAGLSKEHFSDLLSNEDIVRLYIENCFRELEEEAGLSREHFSDLPSNEDIVRLYIEKIYNSVCESLGLKNSILKGPEGGEGGETKEEYRITFRF